MKTVPLAGTLQTVTFFEDDTIETVRQFTALAAGSHPDRLFLEVKAALPKDYYENPLHWSALFYRLSFDGARIVSDMVKVYTTQIRPGTSLAPRDITKEEWDAKLPDLAPLFAPEVDFEEWRVLGVDESKSFCMPIPARDLPALQGANRPVPQLQSLYETFHPYPINEIQATEVIGDSSPLVRLNYYPRLRADTPTTIEPLRASLEAAQAQFRALLQIDTPAHETVSIVRAKWYIPLVSTQFTAPRTRFEQMFYGLTVSEKTTPYVGFFTAKTETLRHKFYVADPAAKEPSLEIPIWRSWISGTMPQRRLPTLLLYRGGKSRTSFDRISITERDIVVNVRREKTSTATLEELRLEMETWLLSLDSVMPFLNSSDLRADRWQLSDLSVFATYAKEVREFDMLRFPCLQSVFGFQNDVFRLLRAEHASDDVSPRELQVLQVLGQEDSDQTAESVAKELEIPVEEADRLIAQVRVRAEEINFEKSLRAYPTMRFGPKEVIVKFVTNLERTLQYVDTLRHVLTSDSEQVDAVCPKRMERVTAKVVVPQTEIEMEEAFAADDDFNALLGFGEAEPVEQPVEAVAPIAPPKGKKVKVLSRAIGTYNYFNTRLQEFDPNTFDKSIYPNKCDKPRQVVVLTPEDKARIGSTYDYSSVPEEERIDLTDPNGTAICPPYWCVMDRIPLREEQLVTAEDGTQRCPECNGKVRTADDLDLTDYPVIKRDLAAKYPNYLKADYASTKNGRLIPCCYQSPRSKTATLTSKEEPTYVLDATSQTVGPLRFAYLESDLASRMGVTPTYSTSVKKGRIGAGQSDLFRVGIGRPAKTAKDLFGKTPIPRPRDAKAAVVRCSFVRTWKTRGPGDTELDRIVSSIDQAYQQGSLSFLEELEYVAAVLSYEVIRINRKTGVVECGFGVGAEATTKTIAVLGDTVLAKVSRAKTSSGYKTQFETDLRSIVPKATLKLLLERHTRACAVDRPMLSDAVTLLKTKGQVQYQVILDPFQRIQAVLVPGKVLLPVQPLTTQPDAGVSVRSGYADLQTEELPIADELRDFVADTIFDVKGEVRDAAGRVVELELASGFRIPVQPEDSETPGPVREVTDTIRRKDEAMLVNAPPNAEDQRSAEDITYASEIFEFLLFSISKAIATDASGAILNATYAPLRAAIEGRSATLLKDLEKWFKTEAYEDTTKSPVEFVNKVRTPCGQLTNKEACASSKLCGWKTEKGKGVCKIRVKSTVDKGMVLRRMMKVLRENDKQRALVLDGRMSPFFSTILYLEMPHELITTSI